MVWCKILNKLFQLKSIYAKEEIEFSTPDLWTRWNTSLHEFSPLACFSSRMTRNVIFRNWNVFSPRGTAAENMYKLWNSVMFFQVSSQFYRKILLLLVVMFSNSWTVCCSSSFLHHLFFTRSILEFFCRRQNNSILYTLHRPWHNMHWPKTFNSAKFTEIRRRLLGHELKWWGKSPNWWIRVT